MDEPKIAGLVPWLPWPLCRWQSFTQLVRAERLAALRIAVALVLLLDVLTTYVPHVNDFYGPDSLTRVGERDLFAYVIRGGERPHWYWSIFRGFGHPANLGVYLAGWAVLTGWLVCRLVDRDDATTPEPSVRWNWLVGGWIAAMTFSTFGIWERADTMPEEVGALWQAVTRCGAGTLFVVAAITLFALGRSYRRQDAPLMRLLTFAWLLAVGFLGIAAWQDLNETGAAQAIPLLGDLARPLDLGWLVQPWDVNPLALRLAAYVLAASAFLLLIGCWTRFSTLVAWTLFTSFDNLNHYLTDTGETIRYILLFYVLLTPVGAVWSVDAWRDRSQDARPVFVSPWALRLMFLQLVLLYFSTGVFKLSGASWFEGKTLYHVLTCVSLTRFSFASLPFTNWMLQLGTWTVLIWEVTFPLLVLFRWTRVLALLLGVVFHLGIWITFEIGFFGPYMLCMYVPMLPWEKFRIGGAASATK